MYYWETIYVSYCVLGIALGPLHMTFKSTFTIFLQVGLLTLSMVSKMALWNEIIPQLASDRQSCSKFFSFNHYMENSWDKMSCIKSICTEKEALPHEFLFHLDLWFSCPTLLMTWREDIRCYSSLDLKQPHKTSKNIICTFREAGNFKFYRYRTWAISEKWQTRT